MNLRSIHGVIEQGVLPRGVAGLLLLFCLLQGFAPAAAAQPDPDRAPSFLIILADDLGFSDAGAFGGEISTPHLDRLAREGLRLTGLRTSPTCSPTRAMLLTGTDHHLAGLANMAELITPEQRDQPGYEGHLNDRVVTIAELLQQAGYFTVMSGKWHLGRAASENPAARGFERSFALLEAGHNHFGRPNLPPPSLGGVHYTEDGLPVALPEGFYSSDYFAERLIDLLEDEAGRDRPFFAYLPFTAPHWPLQAPAEVIERYRGKYDQGWEKVRQQRLARQRELGILPEQAAVDAPTTLLSWEDLEPEEQRDQARKMEIYAAMVERMDWNIGRVLAYLEQRGRLDHTVVVFLSDNGAAPDTLTGLADKVPDMPAIEEGSREEWGGVDSMLTYGAQWAQVGTTPRRLYKSVITEGGLVSPTILRYPGFARQQGEVGSAFATVMDLAPTLLEMAGVEHPAREGEPSSPKPARQLEPMRGASMLPYLQRHSERIHPASRAFGWELFGQRALHQGDWKIAWVSQPNGSGRWELYHLGEDPGERVDLADRHLERMAAMRQLWEQYAQEMGIVLVEQPISPYTEY